MNSSMMKKQINEAEIFISNCIKTYWYNSIYYMKESYDIFLNIFFDFITEKGTIKFFKKNDNGSIEDVFYGKYIKYAIYELVDLFDNFNNDSLSTFEKKLYEFIIKHKDIYESNYYIKLILKIQLNNSLSPEETGLI